MSSSDAAADGLDHSNRQGMFLAVIIIFTLISTIMVIIRAYTRAVIVRSFGNDDWAIVASAVTMIAFCTISCLYIYYGKLGYHIWDVKLSPERNRIYRKLQITNQLIYNPVLTLSKASILLFYLRLSPSTGFQRHVKFAMAFIIALAIAIFFADLMQCTPISFFWDKTIEGGFCIDVVAFYFSTAGLSTFTDIWILVMPMPMVWKLHLPLKQRLVLIALFALGGVVCLMSILRLVTFHNLYFVTKDPSHSDASLWSPLECNMAIICASIPSFRPLISHYFPRWLPSGGGLARYHNSGSTNPNVHGSASIGTSSGVKSKRATRNSFSLTEISSSTRSHGLQRLQDNDSEERIMNHMGVSKTGKAVYESNDRSSSSFDAKI